MKEDNMIKEPNVSNYGRGSSTKIENQDILSLRKKIRYMQQNSSLKEISDVIMEESKRLTHSKNCYVAYIDPKNKDSVGISFSHMTGGCQMYAEMGEARFKIRSDGTYGGLLGYSLDTGESFISTTLQNILQRMVYQKATFRFISFYQFLLNMETI